MDDDPFVKMRAGLDQFSAVASELVAVFHNHHTKLKKAGFDKEMANELTLICADHVWETAMRPPDTFHPND